MPFPTEFPRTALGTLVDAKNNDLPHLVLAGYELVGYGLFMAFGDVKYLAGFNFEVITELGNAADVTEKVTARAIELKGLGLPWYLLVLSLLKEFGPSVLTLIKNIREKLNG